MRQSRLATCAESMPEVVLITAAVRAHEDGRIYRVPARGSSGMPAKRSRETASLADGGRERGGDSWRGGASEGLA